MRKHPHDRAEKGRIHGTDHGQPFGKFVIPCGSSYLCVIACDGNERNWLDCGFPLPAFDHVSVTVHGEARCPTWEEMCFIKDLFFEEEELAVQFHPPKSKYVNLHKYCLHLWKLVGFDLPLPPARTMA